MLRFNIKSNNKLASRLKKTAALTLLSSVFLTNSASADCVGFDQELASLASLADLTCTVASNTEGWVADACTSWEDLRESDIPTSAMGVWNLFADNGSATIGSRALDPGVREQGKLVEPGHRVFLLSTVADNQLTIDVDYERGKAGLELDICTLDADGNRDRIARLTDPRRNQRGLNHTITLPTASVVAFKLKPLGNPLNAYKYNIRVTLNNAPAASNQPVTSLERNIDRPGRDYRNFSIERNGVRNPRWQCRKACRDDEQCQAWTFVKGTRSKAPHCWLKDSVPQPRANACCDSGVRS